MTTAIKRRRGTTAEHSTFVGLEGEITIDSTKDTVVVHDGSTAGGFPLAKENNATLTGSITLSGGTANGVTYLNGSKVLTSGSALTFDGGSKLTVTGGSTNGELRIIRTSTYPGDFSLVAGGQDSTTNFNIFDNTNSQTAYLYIGGASGYSAWYQNGSEQMRLTSTGLDVKGKLGVGYSDFSSLPTNGAAFAGSVGIGTSSPAAPTSSATTLHVHTPTSAKPVALHLTTADTGSTANDGTTLVVSATSGSFDIIQREASNVRIYTSGVERLKLDSAGNLGLGVTPSAWGSGFKALNVSEYGSSFVALTSAPYTWVGSNWYNDGSTDRYVASNSAALYRVALGSHAWFIAPYWDGTGSDTITFNQAMTLNASGNLGVGTTDASNRIQAKRDSTTDASNSHFIAENRTGAAGQYALYGTRFDNGSGSGFTPVAFGAVQTAAAGRTADFVIAVSDTDNIDLTPDERLRITSSGNVGIGTDSPQAKLEVNGGYSTYIRISGYANNTADQNFGGIEFYNLDTSGIGQNVAAFIEARAVDSVGAGGQLVFATSPTTGTDGERATERLRITSTGNLLVGTTDSSPIGNGVKGIVVNGTDARFDINRNGNTPMFVSRFTSAGSLIDFYYSGSFKGSISTNGSTVSYNTSSDYRLKEDIQPMTGALAKVQALKPVIYKWKVDGSDGEGFIAHELAEVVPEAVTGEKDAVDDEGNPVYQGIDQSKLVPLLTAALQEALTKIDSLTARIEALEGN